MAKPQRKGKKTPRVSWTKVNERVKMLAAKLKRPVKAQDIVADAKAHKDAPYHRLFTWNIAKAARERWLDQARQILGRIKVKFYDPAGNAVTAREWINIVQEEPASQTMTRGYVPLPQVLQNTDLKRQCVEQAKTDLETFKNRWKTFAEISAVFPSIDAAIMQLQQTKFKRIPGGKGKQARKKAK